MPKFKIEIHGIDKLRAKIAGMTRRMNNMEPALLRAGMVVLKAAKDHIAGQGGGSWPATVEQLRGGPLFRTGRLINSLSMGGEGNVSVLDATGITVGTNLKSESGFSYPRALQEGTGIYGPSGSPITPKNGKFLVFVVNGKRVFAKSVKGSPPRPFLWIDEPIARAVRTVFANWVMRGSDDTVDE